MNMKKIYIVIVLVISALTNLYAEKSTWEIPADKAEKLSPTPFTEETRKAGEVIYNANCVSCHGNPSKKNFIPLVPEPGDPADEKFSSDLDGELLYKLQEGRGAMPSFKATLSTSDLWNVISYIRSFHKDYVQKVAEEIVRSGLSGGKVNIKMVSNTEKNTIDAVITEVKADTVKPITGALVKLFAMRKFGSLQLDEERETNNEGVVSFAAPSNLPGDSTGNVELMVRLTDEEAFGDVRETAVLAVGKPTITKSLIAERAMWGTVQKAPIWILLTYSLGVLSVWSVIFFIVFQIRKIYLIGKKEEMAEQK